MMTIRHYTLALTVLCFAAQASLAATLTVNTSNSGGFTNLDSVDDSLRGTIPVSAMNGVTVFHFNNQGTNNANLIQPGGLAALPSPRQLVMQDNALNSGIINPSGGSTLAVGTMIDADTPGLGLRFNAPVANFAGNDAVFFELSVGAGQDADDVFISLLDGTNTVLGSLMFDDGDYAITAVNQQDAQVINVTPTAETLAELNANSVTNGAVVDAFWNVLDIDFSDFGLADGVQVHGIFIGGDAIDPTFVGGLNAVPEPATVAIWSLLGVLFGAIAYRQVRKQGVR